MLIFAVLTVLVATGVSMAFGAFYYSIFAKQWMAAAGLKPGDIRSDPMLYINAAFCILVCAAFLYTLLPLSGLGGPVGGVILGIAVAITVAMTTMNVNHRFQGAPVALTFIDGGHWVGVMGLQGLVIGLARSYFLPVG